MDKAEEFWQSKNGGKDSKTATEHGELITPIYAVKLIQQYADEQKRETAINFYKWMESDFAIKLDQHIDFSIKQMFDEWKSNQEEQQ